MKKTVYIPLSCLMAVLLVACGDDSAPNSDDEWIDVDSGVIDEGDDDDEEDEDPEAPEDPNLSGDGGDDDEEEGPEPSKPWRYYLDGDECDLVSQNCPFANQTCLRERVDSGFGRAICVSEWGHRHEGHTAGWCTHSKESQTTDCEKGMVCLGYLCHVPCDPDGDPCRTGAGGSPQSCVSTGHYPQPYCSSYE